MFRNARSSFMEAYHQKKFAEWHIFTRLSNCLLEGIAFAIHRFAFMPSLFVCQPWYCGPLQDKITPNEENPPQYPIR